MRTTADSKTTDTRRARGSRPALDGARRALGRRGEALAERHLRGRGYRPLARNERTRHGEIDLIVYGGNTIVFVEVKTRRVGAGEDARGAIEHPLYGLGAAQQARLRRLAAAWLAQRPARPGADRLRFDAIAIAIDGRGRLRRLEHVENAW